MMTFTESACSIWFKALKGIFRRLESMLKEQKSWEEIGKKINWCPETAKNIINGI
jgi:hypothetical protein